MKMCMNCDLMHEYYKQILNSQCFQKKNFYIIQRLLYGKPFPEQILMF